MQTLKTIQVFIYYNIITISLTAVCISILLCTFLQNKEGKIPMFYYCLLSISIGFWGGLRCMKNAVIFLNKNKKS